MFGGKHCAGYVPIAGRWPGTSLWPLRGLPPDSHSLPSAAERVGGTRWRSGVAPERRAGFRSRAPRTASPSLVAHRESEGLRRATTALDQRRRQAPCPSPAVDVYFRSSSSCWF